MASDALLASAVWPSSLEPICDASPSDGEASMVAASENMTDASLRASDADEPGPASSASSPGGGVGHPPKSGCAPIPSSDPDAAAIGVRDSVDVWPPHPSTHANPKIIQFLRIANLPSVERSHPPRERNLKI
jgi:hypothetical protein